jgi:putative membrane protein
MGWEPVWRREGNEPDYRFSLANERTFLAWVRTVLALLAAGVLLIQFATHLHPPQVLAAVAVGLALFASVAAVLAYRRWRDNEVAMRHQKPLPVTPLVPLTAAVMALVSLAVAALMIRA